MFRDQIHNVDAWLQFGGPERNYEAVDMGACAILEVIILPTGLKVDAKSSKSKSRSGSGSADSQSRSEHNGAMTLSYLGWKQTWKVMTVTQVLLEKGTIKVSKRMILCSLCRGKIGTITCRTHSHKM